MVRPPYESRDRDGPRGAILTRIRASFSGDARVTEEEEARESVREKRTKRERKAQGARYEQNVDSRLDDVNDVLGERESRGVVVRECKKNLPPVNTTKAILQTR